MSKNRNLKVVLTAGAVILAGMTLALGGVILAQNETSAPPAQGPGKNLIVNGTSAGLVAREIDGVTYVDVQALARAVRGSVTIEARRVLLTIPPNRPATGEVSIPNVDTSLPVSHGLSTDFKRAAIAELSEMREWRGAVGAMITYGLAASDQTAKDYHDQCEDGMNQAAVAVVTDADTSAVRLLKNEFDNMTAWANEILAERKALNGARTSIPSLQQNDRQLAAITACNRFLNQMIVSGVYADDSSCH